MNVLINRLVYTDTNNVISCVHTDRVNKDEYQSILGVIDSMNNKDILKYKSSVYCTLDNIRYPYLTAYIN